MKQSKGVLHLYTAIFVAMIFSIASGGVHEVKRHVEAKSKAVARQFGG